MDSARVPGKGRCGPGTSGPIGVALGPTSSPLSDELVEAALSGAAALGRNTRVVRAGDDQTGLGILLGIGYPSFFMPVFAAPPVCARVIWVGEPLPLLDEANGSALARISRSRLIDVLRVPLRPLKHAPLPGPLARPRASAAIERQGAYNLREVANLARSVDRIVVASRDRCETLVEHGLDADAVPYGCAAATAGPITPPGLGNRDLAFVSLVTLGAEAGRRSVVGRCRRARLRARLATTAAPGRCDCYAGARYQMMPKSSTRMPSS